MTSHSIELDQDSPLNVLEDRRISFLVIYANWCGHCHVFLPVYEKVAHKLKDANFYKIDGSLFGEKASEYADGNWKQYFPSIHVFVNGKHLKEYDGPRDDGAFMTECMEILKIHAK